MIELEKDIEGKLRDMVKQTGGLCLKWVCPGWAGVPDRIVLLPRGRVIFVETKRPKGGRLSERQKKWGEKLTRMGFMYYVVWDRADLANFELRLRPYTFDAERENALDAQNKKTDRRSV